MPITLHAEPWPLSARRADDPILWSTSISASFFMTYKSRAAYVTDLLWSKNCVIEMMQDKARAVGARQIVGWNLLFDPFAEKHGKVGLYIQASGIAVP